MNWFVELPSDTQLAVVGLIVVLVDLAVTALISYVPWLAFLEEYKEEWGLMLGAVAVEAVQNWLPSQYPEASVLAVQLVLAIIAIVLASKKFLAKRGAIKLL
jgi:hypothetical protein